MPFVEWNPSIATGIERIDEQHKELFRILNDLFDAMTSGRGDAAIDDILDRMIVYAGEHFVEEEAEMDAVSYPLISAHRAAHAEWLEATRRFRFRREVGATIGLPVDTLTFLHDWLTRHIGETDARFAAFRRERGAAADRETV